MKILGIPASPDTSFLLEKPVLHDTVNFKISQPLFIRILGVTISYEFDEEQQFYKLVSIFL